MKVATHARFQKIREQLRETAAELFQPWNGTAYRVTTIQYSSPKSILLGQGSFLHGGRWNAMGSCRAVYGSTEDTVAVAESRATAEYAHVPLPFRTPRLLVAIELSLQRVLDLTSNKVRQTLDLTLEELRAEDWRKVQEEETESFTQAIGRAIFVNRGEGLLATSARVPSGINVVYFPENQQRGSSVQVLESEKLERIRFV